MPICEEKRKREDEAKTLISTNLFTSFTPRQVLLSSKTNMKQQKQTHLNLLTSDQRVLLNHSICHFLELNGFLKSLKKFRREANLEKDSWKSCSLNLEEMCQEHLRMRNNASSEGPDTKQKDEGVNHVASFDTVEETKENGTVEGKKPKEILEYCTDVDDDVKSKKKKKKNKSANDLSNNVNGETQLKDVDGPIEDASSVPNETGKKSKDKKKKNKHDLEPLVKDLQEKQAEVVAGEISEKTNRVSQKERLKSKKSKEDTSLPNDEVVKEKKSSKKRKKSSSDDNDTGHIEQTPLDNSKRQKIDNSDQLNGVEQATKTPNGSTNGVMEKYGEKFEKQNKSKERNGSIEPTSIKAFQRVKADEVEFADDRLQDNSYWAKDGANSGYGAKAQEVLGQVRGRGFRHEKTKKKRGSYRGGQIDLQCHSVKFNYDDEDE